MKTKIFYLTVFLMSINFGFAQHTQTLKIIKKAEVPEVVVNTVEEYYPNENEVVWYSVSSAIEEPVWEVDFDEDDYFKTHKADQYSVLMKGTNYKRYMVYDKNGKLVRMKETVKDSQLPVAIINTLKKDYKGWTPIGNKEKIVEGLHNKMYFKVKLQKGNQKQIVFFDLVGNTFLVRK